jgi:hypothetical protein
VPSAFHHYWRNFETVGSLGTYHDKPKLTVEEEMREDWVIRRDGCAYAAFFFLEGLEDSDDSFVRSTVKNNKCIAPSKFLF